MSCSDMKYSENLGQTVPGDSTLRMNQTKNRPVERSVASLFCWVTELKFDWLLSCYCEDERHLVPENSLKVIWRFFPRKRRKVSRFQFCNFRRKNQLNLFVLRLPKIYANWGKVVKDWIGVKIIIYLSLSLVLSFVSHRLYLARKYVHQRKVWKPGISLNSEMNEVFTLYCTAIWQLQNNTYIFQKVSFRILYIFMFLDSF